jgi:group II intron reverse transcriptase/maturase
VGGVPIRISDDELWEAWTAARRGGRAAGPDGVSLQEFGRGVARRLAALGRRLRSGRYAPGPYRRVCLPKPTGGVRTICVANVGDRVVQRALHHRLLPHVEAVSLPCSFAYRPSLSYRDAWAAVARHRASGFQQVLETDVEKCFDRIRIELVREMITQVVRDQPLIELVLECLTAAHEGAADLGLPQGAAISPCLCNLVLTDMDRALARRHMRLVRYADDMVVMCRSHGGVERALERAEEALASLGLSLNRRKTQVSDFRSGFDFLGARFVGGMVLAGGVAPYGAGRPAPSPRRRRPRKLTYVF